MELQCQHCMSLFSFLNPAKDFALEAAVKLWFNQTQKRFGHMTNIQIDSTAKSIHVELGLKGESAPMIIDVKSYNLSTESGETFIEFGDIESSREWINQLISDYLPQEKKRFKVPGAVKMVL
jgi:hypothetical protein